MVRDELTCIRDEKLSVAFQNQSRPAESSKKASKQLLGKAVRFGLHKKSLTLYLLQAVHTVCSPL